MIRLAIHDSRYRSGRRFPLRWLWLLVAAVGLGAGTAILAQQPESRQAQNAASAATPCALGPSGTQTLEQYQSVEQQMCLGEHIPGFGGYNYVGPCEVIAYLINLEGADAAHGLLERHIKANSPDCGDRVSLNIRKGDCEFVDLHRLGNRASELLLRDEATRIPGADDVMGPMLVDNRVNFFVDPESLTDTEEVIARAEQVLLAHGFDLGAFQFTSNPFSSKSLSYYLLGVSDPCVPVNAPLFVCFDVQDVQARLVDGTSTMVMGAADLQSNPDLTYAFMISWDVSVSLEEYANALMQEEDAEWTMLNPKSVNVEGYSAIRYDLEPAPTADLPFDRRDFDPNYQDPKMLLLIDTGSGIATIIGTPRKPEVSSEELYAGAESVARILRIRK